MGPPRSGRTILGALLAQHSSVAYFEEPRSVWRYGNESVSDLLKPSLAREEVKQHIRNYFVTNTHRAGKTRMLEKTPQNCLRPDFMDAVFPDARYVAITRDPYATIASIASFWRDHTHSLSGIGKKKILEKIKQTSLRQLFPYSKEFIKRALPSLGNKPSVMWGPRLPGLEGMVKDLTLNEVAAYQWRYCTEYLSNFAQRNPNKIQMWSLEKLNEAHFREILEFSELSEEVTVMKAFNKKFAYQKDLRTKEINETFVAEVYPIIAPTLALLKEHNRVSY